jgi:hypothetical protein
MAITWKVSHPERLIIAYGKEAVTATDILYSADTFARTGINTYRKLFDLTRLTGAMPQLDMKMVGERMKVRATGQPFGPIAVVVSTDGVAGAARTYLTARWLAALGHSGSPARRNPSLYFSTKSGA